MATTSFARGEEGQDLIEYGLLVMFIALIAVAGVQVLGVGVGQMWTQISTELVAIFR